MTPTNLSRRAAHKLCHFLLVVILSGYVSTDLSATHNRAGEITYVQTGDLSICATIVTYTKTSSVNADRQMLTLYWGDGDSTVVFRVNGTGDVLDNNIKRNEYTACHTYPTRGTYKLTTTDPNRVAGILNVDFPNSINIKFFLETTFTLLEPRFQGRNSSVVLLQPPIDLACVGEVFIHNPNAYDPDGDSLSYELVAPFAIEGQKVPNYELPDQINPGPDNMISLDPVTGDFTWTTPQVAGEYNITYQINEYRAGFLINTMVRDMQILVRLFCEQNNPPDLSLPEEICVIAGEKVSVDFSAMDIDSGEILSITASGGPFQLEDSPAILELGPALANSMRDGKITWQTTCDHISVASYQIVVRVTDEPSKPRFDLATLRTLRIRVVAPPPLNPTAENVNNVATITWDSPYTCEEGRISRGFSVWRRIGSANIEIDTCNGGLFGYERIVFLTDDVENGRYVANDAELDPGNIYCYRVVPEFAETTPLGNAYNAVSGIPSEEVCIRVSGGEPLITNVSIISTGESSGAIELKWLNPNESDIDTDQLIGPYGLDVRGTDNLIGSNLSLIQSYNYAADSFSRINDTMLLINDLNTSVTGHSYDVTFTSGDGPDTFSASSDVASSVFLTVTGSDESAVLNWEERVPWNNFQYNIYEVVDSERIQVGTTTTPNYRVSNLINGEEYCYIVESLGKYNIEGIREPLINYSNESCGTAMDDSAPCPPNITVSSVCDAPSINLNNDFANTVSWIYNSPTCNQSSDLKSIRIYFSDSDADNLEFIEEVTLGNTSFVHQLGENIAGCYAVTAVDFSGNESEFSEIICVDNCPSYVLPNTFTPNSDSANDVFTPRQSIFIDRVDFKVFNRWGNKVFETSDPIINWDGTNLDNKLLAEGTYYYTCAVFEKRVTGISPGDLLKGTIQLIR